MIVSFLDGMHYFCDERKISILVVFMLTTLEWSAVKTWRIKVDENIEKTREFSKKKDKLINSDSSNSFRVELGLSPS